MIYPRFSFRCPSKGRGSRECRVRAAPAVSCARCTRKSAHEHTGSAEAVRHSLRNGLTAYALLSPATNSSCHRRCRLEAETIRLDRIGHRQLGTSNGCRDHTVLPYADSAVRPARRVSLTSSISPRDHLARQRCRVHRIPSRVRDDSRSAPLAGKGRGELVELICPATKAEYFSQRGWTTQISLESLR
jgi:hypothetical protein